MQEAETRAEIRGWIWMWMFAVGIQGKRALEPEDYEHPEVDAYLFAIALEPGGFFVIEVGVPDLRRLPPGEDARVFSHAPGYVGSLP